MSACVLCDYAPRLNPDDIAIMLTAKVDTWDTLLSKVKSILA